ncbi:MAG: NusG domain II-containing protein [Bacillota bacterium]
MKKGDALIIVFLLIISGLSWLLVDNFWEETDLKKLVIEVDGAYYDTIDLEEQLFQIKFPENKYIELAIKDGEVWVNDETVFCPRKICVETGKIKAVGQSIVCLPNKTVIYITSQGDNSQKAEPIVDEVVF